MIKNLVENGKRSRSVQWALVGTSILTILIANEATLTLLCGEPVSKGILLSAAIMNGVIVALMRSVTTKPLEEL